MIQVQYMAWHVIGLLKLSYVHVHDVSFIKPHVTSFAEVCTWVLLVLHGLKPYYVNEGGHILRNRLIRASVLQYYSHIFEEQHDYHYLLKRQHIIHVINYLWNYRIPVRTLLSYGSCKGNLRSLSLIVK